MTTLHHEIHIHAPPEKVWGVLADLEQVPYYNPGVARARYISPNREGIGAARQCDFRPKGWGKERVIGWEPNAAIAMELYESNWPVRRMRWKTSMKPDGRGTLVKQDIEYELKFGFIGKLMDVFIMRGKLDQGIADIFTNLKRYIETGAKQSEGA